MSPLANPGSAFSGWLGPRLPPSYPQRLSPSAMKPSRSSGHASRTARSPPVGPLLSYTPTGTVRAHLVSTAASCTSHWSRTYFESYTRASVSHWPDAIFPLASARTFQVIASTSICGTAESSHYTRSVLFVYYYTWLGYRHNPLPLGNTGGCRDS